MSVQVQQIPYMFGWAKNRNSVRLHCNDISNEGTTASFTFVFANSAPAYESKVVVVLDGRELAFTRKQNPTSAYEFSSIANLGTKIKNNPYISALFNGTYTSNTRTLALTAKAVGYHTLTIYTLSAEGHTDGYENTLISSSTIVNGTDWSRLANYGVAVAVDVTVNQGNSLRSYQGETMVLQPDDAGDITVPLDVLRGYAPEPDVPSSTDSQFQLLTNALMRYSVRYGEQYGDPAPLLHSMTETAVRYALCGEVAERFAQANLPDWKSGQNNRFVVGSNNIFWIIGEDTGLTCTTRLSAPVYLYGLWFDESRAFGESLNVNVAVSGKRSNGTNISVAREYSAANGSVYRLKASAADFGIGSDVLWYSVVVSSSGGSWQRTYHVQPDSFESTTLLLQNKYGLLQPFLCGELVRNVTMDGEACNVNRRRYVDITESYEVYTAVMHRMTPRQASALASCIGQRYHYILNGTSWLRITIEPATWKVRDDAEGLVDVQFDYRFVENQQENTATGSLSQGLSYLIDDVWEEVAIADDHISPDDNIILN